MTGDVICPNCGAKVPLDETLAAPLLARVRAEAEERVRTAEAEAERRTREALDKEAQLAARSRALAEQEAALQAKVDSGIAAARAEIARTERERARGELQLELNAERERQKELELKLAEAQRAELALRKEKEAIDRRAQEVDLEIARKLDAERGRIAEEAQRAASDALALKLAEKDKTIADMQAKLEEAQRKGYQGSQQLQGEVLELDFEAALRQAFPQDAVESVKSGARGGDVLQHVLGQLGRPVGTVLWEIKRTQAWGGDWVAKAKQDAAAVKAELVVIVSEALPRGIDHFGPHEGAWVTRPGYATMVGVLLRHGLIQTVEARGAALGRETKMERLYAYMTGPEFRATIEGIAHPFVELRATLETEKRTTLTRWKKQERLLERVLLNVAALQGDLQGIAGQEMAELPSFSAGADEEEE